MKDLLKIKKEFTKIAGDRYKENISLSKYTSFNTGGLAEHFICPKDVDEVKSVYEVSNSFGVPVFILGRGTNTLISDDGFRGVVISTENLNNIYVEDNIVVCESGVSIASLLKTTLSTSLKGIEFMVGIPGTLGGAVISNAGLKNIWISHLLKEIGILYLNNLKTGVLLKDDINFGYRISGLENVFVYKVVLVLEKSDKKEIQNTINCYMKKRGNCLHPEGFSAGSIFKNPENHFAGKLIEEAGLKGFSVGGAKVSEKHANFIINTGSATSAEIYSLLVLVQKKVKQLFNISLEPEIKIIGNFDK
ncbi:UDP-N-acetylmuramate dehydrogenase [bacterium]|nr:UDP-N-acetylmuramate dehydrogenase [bacterium]